MDLKWTKLRHEMLIAIRAGRVTRGVGADGWAIGGVLERYGHASRTVDALAKAGLASLDGGFVGPLYRTPVVLTRLGYLILTDWNIKHAEKVAS